MYLGIIDSGVIRGIQLTQYQVCALILFLSCLSENTVRAVVVTMTAISASAQIFWLVSYVMGKVLSS